jgi:hypothetical protein
MRLFATIGYPSPRFSHLNERGLLSGICGILRKPDALSRIALIALRLLRPAHEYSQSLYGPNDDVPDSVPGLAPLYFGTWVGIVPFQALLEQRP